MVEVVASAGHDMLWAPFQCVVTQMCRAPLWLWVAELLVEVDQWLLADLKESLAGSVEIDHERENRAQGNHEHHGAQHPAPTGQASAVPR